MESKKMEALRTFSGFSKAIGIGILGYEALMAFYVDLKLGFD